mgnify:CR=1 FL=1
MRRRGRGLAAAVITLIAAGVSLFIDDRLAAATFGAKQPASVATDASIEVVAA